MSKQELPVVDLNAVACCAPIAVRPMDADQAAVVAPMFKALGDPIRLRLMSMIASAPEICVCDLTPAFDLSGPTISHHLKVLREAGLVDSERRGTWVWYRVQPEAFRQLGALLEISANQPAGGAA
ncbi:metalloregulator ArsR/SmtB family transcription factor [Micromonospora yasonensis]|uniref:ArsR/SmtB family transcription factor n=1 Tax=Micromonospora yasonensis TaxID=1128667 RepID=UPI00222F6754|nr:metalloregulator ArsR/SmtB family transcription factor [Micromonospora yasonensis]MCW3843909.1 metalloregulator ArsR/SmtB family transcription factor [Micromonospora yasonensis]